RVASAGRDDTVKLWDATTGQEILTLRGNKDPVTRVVFSADGSRLASADVSGGVKIWNATPLEEKRGHPKEGGGEGMRREEAGGSESERRLRDVLAAYREAVAAGRPADPQEWLARHPDLAAELAAFFAKQEQLAQATASFPPAAGGAPAAGAPPAEAPPLPPEPGTPAVPLPGAAGRLVSH